MVLVWLAIPYYLTTAIIAQVEKLGFSTICKCHAFVERNPSYGMHTAHQCSEGCFGGSTMVLCLKVVQENTKETRIQRNLSIVDTIGTQLAVLYREVSLIQRYICT